MRRLTVMLLLFVPLVVMGQRRTAKEKPFWADGYFEDLEYSYIEVVSAFDYDLQSARDKAAKEIIRKRSISVGAEAKVVCDGNNISVESNKNLIVKSRIISEYIKRDNGYIVYYLVQTAKNPSYQLESVAISDKYKVGVRAFIPGMGQLYKSSKAKGYSFIALQSLSVAGIVLCESERSINMRKAKEQPKFAKEYHNRAQQWEIGRNVSIGVAASVYIWNIIDAYVAKGRPRIVTSSASNVDLTFNPYISTEASGLSMALHF